MSDRRLLSLYQRRLSICAHCHSDTCVVSGSLSSILERSRSPPLISSVISLCSSVLNKSSSTARFLRCRSILRSMASRMETISCCSSNADGKGIGKLRRKVHVSAPLVLPPPHQLVERSRTAFRGNREQMRSGLWCYQHQYRQGAD